MKNELVHMKMWVEEEKSLMQKLCMATLRKNLNPIWIK
jgi:hypothetical protein